MKGGEGKREQHSKCSISVAFSAAVAAAAASVAASVAADDNE